MVRLCFKIRGLCILLVSPRKPYMFKTHGQVCKANVGDGAIHPILDNGELHIADEGRLLVSSCNGNHVLEFELGGSHFAVWGKL